MDRLRAQNELLSLAGDLFRPLRELVGAPEHCDADDRARTFATFAAEYPRFLQEVNTFARGEHGRYYERQAGRCGVIIIDMLEALNTQPALPEEQEQAVRDAHGEILATIREIPVPAVTASVLAGSPFSAYCFIRDRINTATRSVTIIDAYLDTTVFHRYLRDLDDRVGITLVTSSSSNLKRYREVVDIARLFAQGRANGSFRLMINENLHGRWLVVDDNVYQLDASVKDAAKKSNFSVTTITDPVDGLLSVNADVQGAIEETLSVARTSP